MPGPGHAESKGDRVLYSRRLLRGLGCGVGGGLGGIGGGLLLHPPHRPDRQLVEAHEGKRERQLAEHVGRRQHGGDDESADDEVAPLGLELVGGDDADATKQREDHGKLERDAEREDQLHHQGQVVLDLGEQLDRRLPRPAHLLHTERKARQHRPDQPVDHERPEQEEDRRRDQVRQERLLLVAIEAGRHEHVDLRGDDGKGDEGAAEHRELELHHEIFEQAGIDELGVLGARDPDERPGQHVVDGLGEEEADHEGDAERDDRLDQPRPQLDQVLHQRRLGGLDLLVFVLAGHAGLPPASGFASAPAGSLVDAAGALAGAAGGSGSAGGASGGGAAGVAAVGGRAIAFSIWFCVLSNSRRTSLTGSKFA